MEKMLFEDTLTIRFYCEFIIEFTDVEVLDDKRQVENLMDNYNRYKDGRYLFHDKENNSWIELDNSIDLAIYEEDYLEDILRLLIIDETLKLTEKGNDIL